MVIKISINRMDMGGIPIRGASTMLYATPSPGNVAGVTFTVTANEAQAFGDAVQISAGKAALASANVIATSSGVFLATATTTSNNPFVYLAHGVAKFTSSQGWTAGNLIYLSTTGTTGTTLTTTAPSATDNVVQVLGVAMGSDTFYFSPTLAQVEHA